MYSYLKAPKPITVPGGMPGPLGGSPGSGPDIIKIWADTKAALFDVNGAYEGKVSASTGRAVPRISVAQAEEYFSFWRGVAQRLLLKLADAGRPQWSLQGAFYDATSRWTTWLAKYNAQRSYRFVSFTAADEFFNLLGRFVNEIDAGVWTGYNTETDWESAKESLTWVGLHPLKALAVTGEQISKGWDWVKDQNDKLLKELGYVWTITKWGSIALIAAYAYRIATKEKK